MERARSGVAAAHGFSAHGQAGIARRRSWAARRLAAPGVVLGAGLALFPAIGCAREPAPPLEPEPDRAVLRPPPLPRLETDPARRLGRAAPPCEGAAQRVLEFVEVSARLPQSGTWLGAPTLGDVDLDGHDDLVASNSEESGLHVFLAPVEGFWRHANAGIPRALGHGPALVCNLDDDRVPDLVFAPHVGALRTFHNHGGSLRWSPLEISEGAPEVPWRALAAADVDGDGKTDVAGIGYYGGGIAVWSGDGYGELRYREESRSLCDEHVFGRDLELADLDQDGRADLVAATSTGVEVFLTRAEKPLGWERRGAGLPRTPAVVSLLSLAVGRFRGGAWPEIAICRQPTEELAPEPGGTLALHAFDPDAGTWRLLAGELVGAENCVDVQAGDLDGDGRLDLAVSTVQSGVLILLGDGAGAFARAGRLPGERGPLRLALGDVDADGRTDVAVARPGTRERPQDGGLRVFLNRAEIWR